MTFTQAVAMLRQLFNGGEYFSLHAEFARYSTGNEGMRWHVSAYDVHHKMHGLYADTLPELMDRVATWVHAGLPGDALPETQEADRMDVS